jgi:hypothetical protein
MQAGSLVCVYGTVDRMMCACRSHVWGLNPVRQVSTSPSPWHTAPLWLAVLQYHPDLSQHSLAAAATHSTREAPSAELNTGPAIVLQTRSAAAFDTGDVVPLVNNTSNTAA